ncbi:hypothetical protein l11_07130 [Neisseria weaveri LMG 5135]|nr:hypothetical protein l13_05390 [Neisseria weaveri ATCC 51223]EGV38141.1 hypothetical protein l11_07130 [Neisseria weaveri LMG 5135]
MPKQAAGRLQYPPERDTVRAASLKSEKIWRNRIRNTDGLLLRPSEK